MNKINLYISSLIILLTIFGCSKKNKNQDASPDINNDNPIENIETENNEFLNNDDFSKETNIERNMPLIIEDLRKDIKNLKAELDYQNENLSKLEAQSQVWANPFSIYNKEIVLNNGSSVFGKIIYQDQDVMKVETLIGQLIIDRNTIVRVVNQISAYGSLEQNAENMDETSITNDPYEVNLIQKRIQSKSAKLVLIGDIKEEKDNSGNTVLTGEIKNIGNKRADFSKIIFTFRTNWQGDTKTLTTFIDGVTNTFDTGISSDNSILPHAVGNFELIIPKSFGSFIGYSYDIDWSQYEG